MSARKYWLMGNSLSNALVGDDFSITPSKDINIRNGVSTFDVLLIQKHILTIDTLESPYKIIAADVNKSNSVSALDLVLIRKVILFDSDSFPNNTSWRFVQSDYVFPNPINPFSEDFPEFVEFLDIQGNSQVDFTGLKVGDVNTSANPDEFNPSLEERNANDTLQLFTENQTLETGTEVLVPIKSANFNTITGFQFTVEFDPRSMEYLGFEEGVLAGFEDKNIGKRFSDNGFLTISWDEINSVSLKGNDPLFYLKFKVLKEAVLSKTLDVSSKLTRKEAYDFHLNILTLDFKFSAEKIVDNEQPKINIFPNPFDQKTRIGFDLNEGKEVLLKVFDLKGQLVHQESKFFEKGKNQFTLNGNLFKTGRRLYCSFDG